MTTWNGVWNGSPCRPSARAVAEIEEILQLGEIVGEEPGGPGGVAGGRMRRVRKPFDPFPVGDPVRRRADRYPQILGSMECGELHDRRAKHAANGVSFSGQDNAAERLKSDSHRGVRQNGMAGEETAEGFRADRFEIIDRRCLRPDEFCRELLRAGAETGDAEIGIVRAPLPEP